MALRRVQKELNRLEALRQSSDPYDAPLRQVVDVTVVNDDPHHWSILVTPEGDHCESVALYGVEVRLDVVFPQDYPFKPPRIAFDAGWLQSIRDAYVHAAPTQDDCSDVESVESRLRSELVQQWAVDWPTHLHVLSLTEGRLREGLADAEGQDRAELATTEALVRNALNAVLGQITVDVKTLTGKSLPFYVRPDCTVHRLKVMIQEREGIFPPLTPRLIFAGQRLEDDRTLQDYGVREQSVIHLVLQLVCNCPGTLLGPNALIDNWSPACHIGNLLRNVNTVLYVRNDARGKSAQDDCGCQFRPLIALQPSVDLVQWAARCCFPARNVVWSRDNDARWPLVFRKIVRYVRRIRVRPGSHATRATLPLDVVELIASFL